MLKIKFTLIGIIGFLLIQNLQSQPIADTTYQPVIAQKAYPKHDGTLIHIDQGHNNFHTLENSFKTFANLLERDGYHIASLKEKFDEDVLKNVEILVIPNAEADNVGHPIVAPTQSAFTRKEIKFLRKWVKKGGSLFLIADHMPFAGASAKLAATFGFKFYDSFAMDSAKKGMLTFSKDSNTLGDGLLTGRKCAKEAVNVIVSFTGQAFKCPEDAESILQLTEEQTVYLPDTMWVLNDEIQNFSARGLSQGAILEFGKGKIAVFGEAAMFTAQLAGPNKVKVGMNSEVASENFQLLLNIIHWLDDLSLCEGNKTKEFKTNN